MLNYLHYNLKISLKNLNYENILIETKTNNLKLFDLNLFQNLTLEDFSKQPEVFYSQLIFNILL